MAGGLRRKFGRGIPLVGFGVLTWGETLPEGSLGRVCHCIRDRGVMVLFLN